MADERDVRASKDKKKVKYDRQWEEIDEYRNLLQAPDRYAMIAAARRYRGRGEPRHGAHSIQMRRDRRARRRRVPHAQIPDEQRAALVAGRDVAAALI